MGTDTSDGGTCPEIITRTWTYADDCGNTASVSQTITIGDITAPIMTGPGNETYECSADVPAITSLAWSDNCEGSGLVTGSESSDGNTCPETIIRTWSYTDACNNTTTVNQTITIEDTITPVMDAAPSDVTLECTAGVPAISSLGWIDNCTGSGTVTGTDTSDGGTCPEIITRTWTYADDCGNTASVSQTITIGDITAPIMTGPGNEAYECSADVPAITSLAWSDNCEGSGLGDRQ